MYQTLNNLVDMHSVIMRHLKIISNPENRDAFVSSPAEIIHLKRIADALSEIIVLRAEELRNKTPDVG